MSEQQKGFIPQANYDAQPAKNTDKEIWRGKSRAKFCDDNRFYADSLFVPAGEVEALGIDCGGTVIIKPIREWHRLASEPEAAKNAAEDWLNEHKHTWSAFDLVTLTRLLAAFAGKAGRAQ